jgi:hypothetical protein
MLNKRSLDKAMAKWRHKVREDIQKLGSVGTNIRAALTRE